MELKPGYKQTEVGVIPEDWEIISLGDIFTFKNGLNKGKEYFGHGTPIVNYMDVYKKPNIYVNDLTGRVAVNPQEIKNYEVRKGDMFFTRTSETVEEIGMAAVVLDNPTNTVFSGFILRARPKNDYLDNTFKAYCFSSEQVRRAIRLKSSYTTRALTNGRLLSSVVIPIPPLAEQRAIATALSDMDALLAAQDQLIAKKRDIKQAVMQQLLTGKQRLPGFSGEWEVKRLGEIGEIAGAGIDKKIRPNEVSVRLVNYLDVYRKDFITSQDLHHFVTATPIQASRCRVRKGDVFFTPSSEVRDDIAHSAVAMENIPDAVYSYHVIRLRPSDDWDLRFRAYAFKTKRFFDQAHMLCDGSGTRYVISQGKFRAMTVLVPPIPEQSSIAAVLSDIDAEIDALQQRRDKTQMLKQGMMQELLTGRTRLV